VAADPQVAALIDNPRVPRERFVAFFLDICGKRLDKDAANFIRLLSENHRLVLLPEIAVTGENLAINDGDSSPRLADGTDFGDVILRGATVSKTFVIGNTGVGTLALGSVTVPNGLGVTRTPHVRELGVSRSYELLAARDA